MNLLVSTQLLINANFFQNLRRNIYKKRNDEYNLQFQYQVGFYNIYQLWGKSIYIMKKKGMFEKDEAKGKPVIAKSCQDNIGEDPIQSDNSQDELHVPRPKSYKSASDDSDWADFNSAQKKQRNEIIAQEYGMDHHIKEPKKPTYKEPTRTDRHFTSEIDQSVEVSVLESSSQQPALGNNSEREKSDRVIEPVKKRQYFNLLLIGAASTGKTTFMECFFKQYKQKNHDKFIIEHTETITEVKSATMSSNLSLDFYIIDTPGYTHSTVNNYSRLVQKEIKDRIENTRKNRKIVMTESSVYQKQERQVRDERIHCCIFFFRGPRLHSDDWRLLQQLHDKCNIIPVIAKGDSYTVQEIYELKKNIVSKAAEKGIKWFDIQEFIRQKHPSQLDSIIRGPYGVSPPFMIACSTTQAQNDAGIELGRHYRWGTCQIENERHTEFNTLKRLLTLYLYDGFVKMINVMQDTQKAKIDKKSFNKKWKSLLGIGVAAVLIVLTAKKIGLHQSIKS